MLAVVANSAALAAQQWHKNCCKPRRPVEEKLGQQMGGMLNEAIPRGKEVS